MADNHKETPFWASLWREALVALTLGWDLAIPIFAGVLSGHFLDRWLGTGPAFTLGLLMLGIGLGYYNIGRFIHRLNQREKQAKTQNDESDEKK